MSTGDERAPDLVASLRAVALGSRRSVTPRRHALLDALGAGPGAHAAVAHDVTHRQLADAVEVRLDVVGPGQVDARWLDIDLGVGDLALHTMRGGRFESSYPPEAFSVRRRSIQPRLVHALPERLTKITFGSRHGMSSDDDVPFFLLSTLDGREGLWFAVSWSGSWRAELLKLRGRAAHHLLITGPGETMALDAGERWSLPSVVVGWYEGDGWAAIRRHLASCRPVRHTPWVVYNTWFNENAEIDESRLLADVAVASAIGVEVVTLDGAWYATDGGGPTDFTTPGIGTWDPDPIRFPRGIEPIAEAVTRAGIRFGMWCEFERAHPQSRVALAHPEWLRTAPGDALALVDLGLPEAVNWCAGMLIALVQRWSVGWLKVDSSTHDIASYWAGDQRAELAHIRGLYAVLDRLRDAVPGLVIEGCASGGNRIDREMIMRCDTFWLSDQTVSPDMVRETVANARTLLPAQYCYLSVSPQLPRPVDRYPDDWFLGVMPGVFGLMDRLREWPDSLRAQAAAHIGTYKAIRHLLEGDAVHLHASASPLDEWHALELSDGDDTALIAHRLLSTEVGRSLRGRRDWSVSIPEPGGATVVRRIDAQSCVSRGEGKPYR